MPTDLSLKAEAPAPATRSFRLKPGVPGHTQALSRGVIILLPNGKVKGDLSLPWDLAQVEQERQAR